MSDDSRGRHDPGSRGMSRRGFIEASVVSAGVVAPILGTALSEPARAAAAAPAAEGIHVGVNLEYVRHADKSLAYGVETAGKLGFKWVEPCFLMGRCLLSNAGYCHVTSLDTDPKEILDLCPKAGVKISGAVVALRPAQPRVRRPLCPAGIRYAKALGVNIVQITEDMYPPKWMTEQDAYAIMKINLLAIAETCEENGVLPGRRAARALHRQDQVACTRILELVEFALDPRATTIAATRSFPAKTPTPCSRP